MHFVSEYLQVSVHGRIATAVSANGAADKVTEFFDSAESPAASPVTRSQYWYVRIQVSSAVHG